MRVRGHLRWLKVLSRVLRHGRPGQARNLIHARLGQLLEPDVPGYHPTSAYIEPSNRCNLSCGTCINKDFSVTRHMTLESFEGVLRKLPFLDSLVLTGVGEPLMNPAIFDMIEIAKRRGVEVRLASNATLLNETLARKLIAAGPARLSISIDSPVADTFERLRPGARFETVVENTRRFAAICPPGLVPNILMVVTNENFEQIPAFMPLMTHMGVSRLDLQMLHIWGSEEWASNSPARSVVGEEGVYQRLRAWSAEAAQQGLTINALNFPDPSTGRRCRWPWTSTFISCEGHVTPCCVGGADPSRVRFGSIHEVEDVGEIWGGERYRAFRMELRSKSAPKMCVRCPAFYGPRSL